MNPMARRTLISISLLAVASVAFGQATPTVYVTINENETLSKQKRREWADSARDVCEQLKKRNGVETAEDRDDADVVVTILDRRIEVNESGTNDWAEHSARRTTRAGTSRFSASKAALRSKNPRSRSPARS